MKDETNTNEEYTSRLISLVESAKGVYGVLGMSSYKKVIRETKNIQVMSLQSFMRGFGFSLASTEKILNFPLSPEYDREKLHTDLLTLARAKIAPGDILKLDRSVVSKGMSGYGYIYSLVNSCFVNACFSEETLKKTLPEEIIERDTAFLTPLYMYEVSPDPVFLPFEAIVMAVKEKMKENGRSRKTLVSSLSSPYRYHLDNLLDGNQHSCGIGFINDIASALGTAASDIYRKAEEIIKKGEEASSET